MVPMIRHCFFNTNKFLKRPFAAKDAICRIVVIAVLTLQTSGMSYGAGQPKRTGSPFPSVFQYGALNDTLNGVNANDAQVAIRMNLDRLHKKNTLQGSTKLEVLPDIKTAAKRIRDGQLHGLSLTGINYIRLRDLVDLEPIFISSRLSESPLEPYVLLTQKGIDLQKLMAQERRRLMVESGNQDDISRIWLDTVLHERALPRSDLLFTAIKEADKPSRMVLPVFFKQAEACLVPESAYLAMVELNPQIGRKLDILMRSPGFVKSMVCLVQNLDPELVDKVKESINLMHDSIDGRQLLMIFQLRRHFVYKPEYLTETVRIYRKYHKLSQSRTKQN